MFIVVEDANEKYKKIYKSKIKKNEFNKNETKINLNMIYH